MNPPKVDSQRFGMSTEKPPDKSRGGAPLHESAPTSAAASEVTKRLQSVKSYVVKSIKDNWPGVRDMARHLGIDLPERDGVKHRHPFRPDNSPSCTIKGDYMYDWSQGDGKPIDSIAFYAMYRGIDNKAAIAELGAECQRTPLPRPASRPLTVSKPAKPPFQKLEIPTEKEINALAGLRIIFPTALQKAADLGHLFFADTKEGRAYVVTDSSQQVYQSRRVDGQPWQFIGSKAWTSIKENGFAGWPLGAGDIGDRQRVILCEGGPDWLVAHEAEPEIAVCAMLGAKQTIHEAALPLFAGKSVRILAHGDDAGAEACRRWATQLTSAGATVTAVQIRFDDAKDLNDCTRLPFARWEYFKISRLLS